MIRLAFYFSNPRKQAEPAPIKSSNAWKLSDRFFQCLGKSSEPPCNGFQGLEKSEGFFFGEVAPLAEGNIADTDAFEPNHLKSNEFTYSANLSFFTFAVRKRNSYCF